MVMPSPFDRMLAEAGQLAQRDPAAAFGLLDTLYGKSLTDLDVRNLGGFAAHLGGAGLGRWDETEAFLRRCLQHPALEEGSESERSLWRALAVIHTCAGQSTEAEQAYARGVTNDAERCRVAILTAQTLAARGRVGDCAAHLEALLAVVRDAGVDEEFRQQISAIAANIARLAERRLHEDRTALLAATAATTAAMNGRTGWRDRHRAHFQYGRALVLTGRPAQALQVVNELMALEEASDAAPADRFASASLACRAQIARAQFKVAAAALSACRELRREVTDETERNRLQALIDELQQELSAAREAAEAIGGR